MASGTQRYRYQTDKGNIFNARTDDSPDLANIRGAEPAGAVTEDITFEVSKNSKAVGCKPRHVKLYLKVADTVEGCMLNPKGVVKEVVVLKPDTVPPKGTEKTVNGRVYVVGPVVGEQMR
jgi:hypothetical protein